MKRFLVIFLAALLLMLAGCDRTDPAGANTSADTNEKTTAADPFETGGTVVTDVPPVSGEFSDGDYKDVTGETPDAVITLDKSTGTISDTTRGSSGSTVTITKKGIYRVTGTSDGVTILVNDTTKSGNIYLVLDGVAMTNTAACIQVDACDKVILQCVGENALISAGAPTDSVDGTIYAKDDLTINGRGTLTVSSARHGIVCKDDLKITGAAVDVTADAIGLQAGDSLRIGGGCVNIAAGHDGMQIKNKDGNSYFYMESGVLTVDAGYDGIDVGTDGDAEFSGFIRLSGGELHLTAGGGSSNSKDNSTSQKGLKCDGDIYIGDVTLAVSSADDAVHSGATISVTNGGLTLSSSDDGIHADSTLSVSGGTIDVTKSYEGLEAYVIDISGGDIRVYAGDDGLNAAGGSDSGSDEWTPWGPRGSGSSGTLYIRGGNIYINASGDGLDSNGSIYVSGGITIVEGPTNGGNGALDKGDGSDCVAEITGGTVLALGALEMAENFDSGSQCAALVTLSGNAGAAVTVDDGSGFTFTTTKPFRCAVYSSPNMTVGNRYTISAGASSAEMDFTNGQFYSTAGGMGGPGGFGGGPGGAPGGFGGQGGPGGAPGGPGRR